MANTAKINVKNQDVLGSFREFFKLILSKEDVSAILVPKRLPMKDLVMPILVTDPDKLDGVDPLAPVFPMNAAKLVSKLSRKPIGAKIAVVLRSCEVRAFVELVKLKQARSDELIIIGIDCFGAYKNTDYIEFVANNGTESSLKFFNNIIQGKGTEIDGIDISSACKACEYPVPDSVDLLIGFIGVDTDNQLMVQSNTSKGENVLKELNLTHIDQPAKRKDAVANIIAERTAYRDKMFTHTQESVDNLEKLTTYLAACVNCYNCRVACPVCYCRECVFVTDVFDHEPSQYLKWAGKKGSVKMPTDTAFFHITRMAHISLACVGCGQCSNACPNDIPVMELFRTIAFRTQKAFDYQPGKNIEELPPLSQFKEHEFQEVVGLGKGVS